jgi:RNA-directed DNA polymerase
MKEKKPFGIQRPRQTPDSTKQTRNTVPWKALEQQVVRLQKQIAQASQRGDTLATHALQQRLIESEAARLLAVHRVAGENQGKDTAGVDGVKSLTLDEQLTMASTIHPRYWNVQPPLPVRRVWIPKSGADERRPLAILPMIDRCKQALVKLALEPEWEVRFEPQSYGFRPGRSTHDALAAILVALGRQPLFVFNADIEAAFDHLNQAVLLDKLQTYPALRRLINAWLTAGVLDGETYSTSETGIAQGGVLSPLLMNIALHGMEAVVTENSANRQSREQPFFVRYADNFLIVHADLNILQQAIKRVKHWLAGMGLHLHPQKTHIAHTLTPSQGQVGFDFLGFHIYQEPDGPMARSKREQAPLSRSKAKFPLPLRRSVSQKVKTIIVPSQEANKRHVAAIEHRLQRLHLAPQARVITELNPLIVGWSTYYTGIVDASIMHQYDDLLEQQLMKWASKRHPGKAQNWLLASYWHHGKGSRIFATPDGKQLRRYQHTSFLNGARF